MDETKDQSYVLYSMTQEQLAHTQFPLGSLRKTEVREIAGDSHFVNAGKPLYVKELKVKENQVILGDEKDLYTSRFQVEDFNWFSGVAPKQEIVCKVKTRYRQKEQEAIVIPTGEHSVEVIYKQPQRAITCGQAAVLYDREIVLGGGTISEINE